MTSETPRSTAGAATTFRNIVIRADPDYIVEAEKLPEYEFGSRGRKREFTGWYKRRGAYADE